MPLADYRCEAGHRFEELFLAGEDVPYVLKCACGAPSRKIMSTFRVVGPVFEHLESYEQRLLSPKDRANGARLRGASDVQEAEKAMGVRPMSGSEASQAMEKLRDESHTIGRIAREGGKEAAMDYVDTREVVERTGCSEDTYRRIKEMTPDALAHAPAD